ncbi:outer membrane protein [Prevotella sp. 10(H)]|uniref:outer membrane protein n=1 Tax=Prevotella sp. 10(H) TaxID=1158294 RepID=UPI0018CC1B8A|nr:porin family protein [Prevotella sp. 10(H)]
MSDKRKYNEQPDDFSKLVRQKLEDYRMPVDADCWDAIELQMKPKQKKYVWWIGGSAAAIAVIVILLLSIPKNDEPPFNLIAAGQNFNAGSAIVPEKVVEPVIENIKAVDNNLRAYAKTDSKKGRTQNEESNQSDLLSTTPVDIDTESVTQIEEKVEEIIQTAESDNTVKLAEVEEKKDSQPISQTPKNIVKERKKDAPRLLLGKKESNDNKWLLAASISSGGGASTVNNNGRLNTLKAYASNSPVDPEQAASADSPLKNDMMTDDFSDIDHALPLSFGASVRKDFNKYLGIETGITYTYLSSKSKKATNDYYSARQEIHYLGIPVNVVGYLWNDDRWNIYVSGGVMMEKGLRFKYTQYIHDKNNNSSEVYNKGSVDGLQWSLNASVGASYMFYNSWGLYFEPRFSYYFDNNQPISIRTEKQSVFGISAGLRYKFE